MTKTDDYREGDLIRATKNGETMQGKLKLRTGSTLGLDEAAWGLDSLEQFGWTVELLERAPDPDPLPTEPGVYCDTDGDLWIIDRNGAWWDLSTMEVPKSPLINGPSSAYAPFTRLYTKDQVMNKVRSTAWAIDSDYLHGGELNVLRQRLEESL